jgi:hypothetical protein
MAEEKLALYLTEREQLVVGMIGSLLSGSGDEAPRIRKLHAQVKKTFRNAENPPSNCLISRAINELVGAKILSIVEKRILEGETLETILYEWDREAFARHNIITVKQRSAKSRAKQAAVEEELVQRTGKKELPEDWYETARRTRREKMAQRLVLDIEIQQLDELIGAIESDIENVRKFFALREKKTEAKKEDTSCPGKAKRRSPKSCAV